MDSVPLPSLTLAVPDACLSTGIPKCTLAQFEEWEPLADSSLPNSYRAVECQTRCTVIIHLFPGLRDQADQFAELTTQLNLFASVCGDKSRLRYVDLDSERPIVVLNADDDVELKTFIEQASGPEQLVWLAEFLHGMNRAFRSRLYHGALSLQRIRAHLSATPQPYIDYVQRFCATAAQPVHKSTAQPVHKSIFQLYQSDVVEAIAAAGYVCDHALESQLWETLIPARKLAILRKLCRDRRNVDDWDSAFDSWLDYFEEWLPKSSTGPVTADPSDATADLAAHRVWHATAGKGADPVTGDQTIARSDQAGDASDYTVAADSRHATGNLADELPADAMLGRFRVDGLIGRGGMGAVYRGTDTSSGVPVALKVLRAQGTNAPQAVRRFNKEARILASIRNDHVTQLLEVGVENGIHYIAMEFVNGIDLKQWLTDRLPMDERSALRITKDIARALVEAHRRNIIHRDIKPANVLLASRVPSSANVSISDMSLDDLIIKLTDFGIAREIEQTQSMEVTRAGGFLGTPHYMSPEQCKGGQHMTASTDVYSLGITLYELLCGAVPFDDADFMKLAALHCFEPVTDIRRRNQRVSEATSQLVLRMLSKNSGDRPADAAQLVIEIERILDGRASDFQSHPKLPDFDTAKLWQRTFEWQLKSSPEALWPHVSNTERLNRAVGLPQVDYRLVNDANLGVRRFGSFRLGGVKIEWEEHPFEWIEGTRMGVLREFATGPFKWFMNVVELKRRADGGTHLVHTVKIEPRNALGRVVSTIEAGWKGGRGLDRVYRRIDESLQSLSASGAPSDVFETPPSLQKNKLARVESRLDDMIAKGADLDGAHKLVDHLRSAPIQELTSIKPLRLADQLQVDPDKMVDVCLVAAASGLLVLQWDILCPTCRVAAKSDSLLANIKQHTECEACNVQFQSNIASAIELTFCVHPEIRETLSGKYCIGGPWHAPHVVTQIRVAAKERMSLPIRLQSGDYLMRVVGRADSQLLCVRSVAADSSIDFHVPHRPLMSETATVRQGMVELVLINDLDHARTFRLERTIELGQVVTAATASTLQRFRTMFPEQEFTPEAPIVTDDLSLLVLQLHGLDKLYHDLGDEQAYETCQEVLTNAQRIIASAGGALVKTSSEGQLSSFHECAAACRAALELLSQFHVRYASHPFALGLAVHRGRTLIAQQNGRIDYFGTTIRCASKLATQAHGCLLLSDAVASDPLVRQLLLDRGTSSETLLLSDDSPTPQIVQCVRLEPL